MKRVFVLAGALAAVAAATPASAQVTVGWDVAANSRYFWRGLTYTSRFVLQPDLYLTIPVGKAAFTAGGWANIEPGRYNAAKDISEGGGAASFDLTEFDWWGEIGVPVGVATITGGATGYLFPNNAGFTKAFNTIEVYGKVGLSVPLNPKLAVWYDVDKVKGAYFEGSVSQTVHLTPAVPLTFGALAGLSEGQGSDPDAAGNPTAAFFNFHKDGLTHGDFSVASSFAAGPVSIAPSIHLVVPRDKLAHSKNAMETASTKFLFGVTISWAKAFGGKEEAKE